MTGAGLFFWKMAELPRTQQRQVLACIGSKRQVVTGHPWCKQLYFLLNGDYRPSYTCNLCE
jgi:hypothetical protein